MFLKKAEFVLIRSINKDVSLICGEKLPVTSILQLLIK
jgi:hypothetical protein